MEDRESIAASNQKVKGTAAKVKAMSFSITTTAHFRASHQLRLHDGSMEALHEHTWQVKVTVSATELDSIGVVMDFHDLTRRLEAILLPLCDQRLNDLPAFAQRNPSAENLAIHIAESLTLAPTVALQAVEVWETPENSAVYSTNRASR
jgi:6-pyruvoyltetrahydropterin/6-carboxytetrahydropterin synthase